MHKRILTNDYSRDLACALILKAPSGYVMELREPRRTLDQNDMMWSILTDVSVSMPGGRRMTPDEWKNVFMHACGWECQFLEGLDGRPFPMGFRSSKLTKSQMSSLIEFILAWGTENGVRWTHEQEKAA